MQIRSEGHDDDTAEEEVKERVNWIHNDALRKKREEQKKVDDKIDRFVFACRGTMHDLPTSPPSLLCITLVSLLPPSQHFARRRTSATWYAGSGYLGPSILAMMVEASCAVG